MNKGRLLTLTFATAVLASCSIGSSGTSIPASASSSESLKEAYETARKNAVEANQFQYDFALAAKIKYKGALDYSPANISGTTYFNKGNAGTQYLQKRTTGGLLLIDSTTYTFNKGTTYIKVAENDGDFAVSDSETIASDYNFESKTFGKLLNYLDESKLSSIETSALEDGTYDLGIKPEFGRESIDSIVGLIDVNTIVDALSLITTEKWGVGLSLTSSVTLANAQIKAFDFAFAISYEDFSLEFSYNQTYSHLGSGVAISVPDFSNALTSESEIQTNLTAIKEAYSASSSASSSYYDYSLKTTVDHGVSKSNPLGLAVNSTSAGFAYRAIQNDKVYFDNRLELDSDYKNKDQYPGIVKDYERYRARVNDGNDTVYDCEDRVAPLSNVFTKLGDYSNDAIDDYYMLVPEKYFSPDYVKILRKSTDKKGNTVYKLGMNATGLKSLLADYDKSIRLDVTLAHPIDVYQIGSDFFAKRCDFEITVDPSNRIDSVSLASKGYYAMTNAGQVRYGIDLSIAYDWDKKAYDIPTRASQIALN
jgi:hypothetical protein